MQDFFAKKLSFSFQGVHDTANKFVGSLIPVSQVVDAFMGLVIIRQNLYFLKVFLKINALLLKVTTDGSGRVRVVLSDLPHIHLPPVYKILHF